MLESSCSKMRPSAARAITAVVGKVSQTLSPVSKYTSPSPNRSLPCQFAQSRKRKSTPYIASPSPTAINVDMPDCDNRENSRPLNIRLLVNRNGNHCRARSSSVSRTHHPSKIRSRSTTCQGKHCDNPRVATTLARTAKSNTRKEEKGRFVGVTPSVSRMNPEACRTRLRPMRANTGKNTQNVRTGIIVFVPVTGCRYRISVWRKPSFAFHYYQQNLRCKNPGSSN